jgi:hypothetical protein
VAASRFFGASEGASDVHMGSSMGTGGYTVMPMFRNAIKYGSEQVIVYILVSPLLVENIMSWKFTEQRIKFIMGK